MKYRTTIAKSQIKCNETYEGESIELQLRRMNESGEPIKDTVGMIYTERKQGVLPQYDIRTDRFEIIQNNMDAMTRCAIASRDNNPLNGEPSNENTDE